jgi:hypothetical protein
MNCDLLSVFVVKALQQLSIYLVKFTLLPRLAGCISSQGSSEFSFLI